MKLVLDKGADATAKNNDGWTVLHLAAQIVDGVLYTTLSKREASLWQCHIVNMDAHLSNLSYLETRSHRCSLNYKLSRKVDVVLSQECHVVTFRRRSLNFIRRASGDNKPGNLTRHFQNRRPILLQYQ